MCSRPWTRCARRGFRLCCVTNKRYSFSQELLVQAGIRDRFELLLGGDSLAEKKPSPLPLKVAAETLGVAPNAAALVGDSHQDLRAARSAPASASCWRAMATARSTRPSSARAHAFAASPSWPRHSASAFSGLGALFSPRRAQHVRQAHSCLRGTRTRRSRSPAGCRDRKRRSKAACKSRDRCTVNS